MIQVYKKNDLFVIENTITETIYPNLTREETVELLKKFDRDEPEDRCDFAIKEDNISFEYASIDDKDKTIADLEAKLAEKDAERELDNSFWKQECDSLQKTLAEKEKEIEYQENMKILAVENQNKKAIEQLEKVKELFESCWDYYFDIGELCNKELFYNKIEQLIAELTHQHEDK